MIKYHDYSTFDMISVPDEDCDSCENKNSDVYNRISPKKQTYKNTKTPKSQASHNLHAAIAIDIYCS